MLGPGAQQSSLEGLAPEVQRQIAAMCGPSSQPALRAACKSLHAAVSRRGMQLVVDPGSTTEGLQRSLLPSQKLAAAWADVLVGDVAVLEASTGGQTIHSEQSVSAEAALQHLHLAATQLAHWRQLEEARVWVFSRSIVTALVACSAHLRVLHLSNYSPQVRTLALLQAQDAGQAAPSWAQQPLQELWQCLSVLRGCSSLRELQLWHDQLGRDAHTGWRALSQLTQLHALQLGGMIFQDIEELHACLGPLTQLTRLVLHDVGINDKYADIGTCPSLQDLQLCRLPMVTQLTGCSQLTRLCLLDTEPEFMLSWLDPQPLHQLRHLDALECQVCEQEDVEWLLASCPQLTYLCLDTLIVPDQAHGAGSTCEVVFPHVRKLETQHLAVESPGRLARAMPSLTSLGARFSAFRSFLNCVFPEIPHSPHFLRGRTALRHLELPHNLRSLTPPGAPGVDTNVQTWLLDPADLAGLQSLTSLAAATYGDSADTTGSHNSPALLDAALPLGAWQRVERLSFRSSWWDDQCGAMARLGCLLRAAPNVQHLHIVLGGPGEYDFGVPEEQQRQQQRQLQQQQQRRRLAALAGLPQLQHMQRLRCLTVDGSRHMSADGLWLDWLSAAHAADLTAFMTSLATAGRPRSLSCVRLLRNDCQERLMGFPRGHPSSRAVAADSWRRLREAVEAAEQLTAPVGGLPFAVHLEEVHEHGPRMSTF